LDDARTLQVGVWAYNPDQKPHPLSAIRGFDDFWKSNGDPLTRAVRAFYDTFSKSCFAESVIQACVEGRLYSPFLVSGLDPGFSPFGRRIRLFDIWRSFLPPPPNEHFITIDLGPVLLYVAAWLSDDNALGSALSAQDFVESITEQRTNLRRSDAIELRRTIDQMTLYLP
jgi:hypothetical protein